MSTYARELARARSYVQTWRDFARLSEPGSRTRRDYLAELRRHEAYLRTIAGRIIAAGC